MAPCASFASFSPTPPPPLSSSSPSPPRRSPSTTTSIPAAPLGVSSPRGDALAGILSSRVIACLRAQSAELAMEAARAAIRGGISVLEVVMTTPGVLEVVQQLRQDYPFCIIGVGTVLGPEDARNAVKAGARFLMSPAMIKEVLFDLQGDEVLYIPGVMTPTEILGAHNAGARIVKAVDKEHIGDFTHSEKVALEAPNYCPVNYFVYDPPDNTSSASLIYPVSVLGGAQYISVLKKPFSHIPMVASQGITIESVKTYIESGASAVVLSDAVFEKAAMTQKNYDEIYRLASFAALQGVQAMKQESRKTC